MAKFLATAKNALTRPPHGTAPRGFRGTVVDKGERFGAAWAFGAIKGYYRERAVFRGVPADLLVGGASLLASAFLDAKANGNSPAAKHLERVGDAGVSSWLNSMGAAWGAKKSGRALAGGRYPTILGYIPPAVAGSYLSADEIAHFAAKR